MTKKEYVLRSLYTLKDIWNYAPALILLIEDQKINDNSILGLYDMISHAIEEATNITLKAKLITAQKHIERIKEMESKENDELGDIERMIQDI